MTDFQSAAHNERELATTAANMNIAYRVKFDWLLIRLLLLALLVRVTAIIAFPSLLHPDENFQLFEQGHRWFFGNGMVPWEFRLGTRSPVMPFPLALTFKAAEPIVGGPEIAPVVTYQHLSGGIRERWSSQHFSATAS
jgi:hypothetical protein